MTEYSKMQQAVIDGVNETISDLDKAIYINPDLCANALKEYGIDYYSEKTPASIEKAIETKTSAMSEDQLEEFYAKLVKPLSDSLNEQLPGAGDKLTSQDVEDVSQNNINIINRALIKGVGAIDAQQLGEVKYGIVILPTQQADTSKEFFKNNVFEGRFSPEIAETIADNLAIDSSKLMLYIGRHEGSHLNGITEGNTLQEIIAEEYRADSIALQPAIEAGDYEFVRAYEAYRALTAINEEYADHLRPRVT